jgi:acetyltransferase-like isoleucine patch superfamily enzyme
MLNNLAQNIISNDQGEWRIEYDWHEAPLPPNIELAEMSYPDTSYSFTTFYSKQKVGFRLGFASGNYGHGIFTTGEQGCIEVGDYVVLQCTRIFANRLVSIGNHCMFSWGSVITDTWVTHPTISSKVRRRMLQELATRPNRHLESSDPQPVRIEDNVWVGFEAVILPGVTIGRGAIVGSRSVVFEDVPAYAVVVGNPARVLRFLEPTDTEEVRQKAILQFIQN